MVQTERRVVMRNSFPCMLLLELKNYLKTIFGLSDSKCQAYSPLEPSKTYDKSISRKTDGFFTSEYKNMIFPSGKIPPKQATK